MKEYDIVIAGAGASGLIAAGSAAETGMRVLVLEKNRSAGRKLLITGKGRCNITNDNPVSEYFNHIQPNGRFLRHAFSSFFSDGIVRLLNEYGVETVVERGNRVFPASNKSADVLVVLLNFAIKSGAEIRYNCSVEKILAKDGAVSGVLARESSKDEEIKAKTVIVCTGGQSYPATGSTGEGYKLARGLGHTIIPTRPALVPLETEGILAQKLERLLLKNINAIVWVNGKKKAEKFGEMQFDSFGLTGPVILTLSRMVVDELRNKNQVEIAVDLKPALDEQKLDNRLLRDLNENGKKQLESIFKLWLPGKLVPVFFEITGIDGNKPGHQVTSAERRAIRILMKDFRFKVTGYRPFKEAIVTAGGIPLNEIDPKTMESKVVKGLYFAGEIIDADADTGGYNLQIAWSTGWLAGKSCAENHLKGEL